MKFKKYLKFIEKYHVKDGELVCLVDCTYQKDQKAIAPLGTIEELRNLQDKLAEMEIFIMETDHNRSPSNSRTGQRE